METITIKIAKLHDISDKKRAEIKQALAKVNGKLSHILLIEDVMQFLNAVDSLRLRGGSMYSKSLKYNLDIELNPSLPVLAKSYKYSVEYTSLILSYVDKKIELKIGRSLLFPSQNKPRIKTTMRPSMCEKLNGDLIVEALQDLADFINMKICSKLQIF